MDQFIAKEPMATQALTLLTNRLLMDFLSVQIDSGALVRSQVESLIRFSAKQVSDASPGHSDAVQFFAELSINRLAGGPTAPRID